MGYRRVAEPAVEPVSLAEAKEHLNIDHDDKDSLIQLYISAARAFIESYCHIIIAESEWELTYDAFPSGAIEIPLAPLISVTSVEYDDENGDEQTVYSVDYVVDTGQSFGWIVPVSGFSWPATISGVSTVRIRFMAGWPNDSGVSTVPPSIKSACLLMVGNFFANREASATGLSPLPLGVEALISPYVVPVLA